MLTETPTTVLRMCTIHLPYLRLVGKAVDPPAENAWPNLGHGNGASTYSAPLPPAAVVSPGRERHSLDNPRRTMPRDAGRREIGGPAGGATTARNGAEGEGGAVQVVPQLVQQTQDEQTQDHLVPTLSLHRHQQQDQVVPGRRQFTTVEQHQQQDDQIVPLR
ncbi:hypothetical protein niasHT_035394 [Heterodera trifolii]|uniref:Uncharacterized protein n=1 Tax=Heterodera trifolii TaxID=157864 RepID=A0ABD2IAD5_9BILA